MSAREEGVDCIYIAASALDSRYTRICVASVRRFYPFVPIRLLAGSRLRGGLAEELKEHWNVDVADLPPGDYGWGFVKLEPLFGSPGERFLVLDSDTVLTGPVLTSWPDCGAPFLVDDENQSEADTKRLYYDWRGVREIDPHACPPRFVFNSGQWFGTGGILTRDDFAPWIEWTMPRRVKHAEHFMPGDQGILNYVLNQKMTRHGMRIERRKIMHWPGRGMQGLSAESVSNGTATPLVIHWAGIKRARQRDTTGGDLLAFFEKAYYRRLRFGGMRRIVAGSLDTLSHGVRPVQAIAKRAFRRIAPTAPV